MASLMVNLTILTISYAQEENSTSSDNLTNTDGTTSNTVSEGDDPLDTGAIKDTGTNGKFDKYANALEPATSNPCIHDSKGEPDADKTITIVEEPLTGNTEDSKKENFEARRCYRHSFQWSKQEGGQQIMSSLSSTECGEEVPAATMSANEGRYSCKEVQVLLSRGGTSLIYGYIGMVYRWGASIVGIIAVLIIVLSGMQIAAAGGDNEAITKAKTRILQSLGGIAVLFLSGLILYTINPNFFRP